MAAGAIPSAELEEIEVGDFVFRARTAGDGDRLVLLLHGFPQTSYMWRELMGPLAQGGYRVIAPDQRGYSPGARPEAVEDYGVDALTGDVVRLAEALGHDRFDVVGHDWGAGVAWGVAAGHPDRLRSVTAVATPHPTALVEAMGLPSGEQARMSAYMALFGAEPGKAEAVLLGDDGAGLRELYRTWGFTEDQAADVEEYVRVLSEPGALTAALNWYRRGFEWASIAPVEVPALYVWGSEDLALGREAAELTEKYAKGPYRFAEFERVSHWTVEHAGDRLLAEIQNHLAST